MNKNVVVKKSEVDKKGVFAARDFEKGEVILKWNPKIVKKSEINNLSQNQKHYICGTTKNGYFLMRSPEKFVNHSCEPNTYSRDNKDIAKKNIRKGEEITTDYKKTGILNFECKCGSKKCRKIIKN